MSLAQVQTTILSDGTLGTAVTPCGTVHEITGGTRRGEWPNLFHSFDRFDVDTGDTAHFVGQPGIDIEVDTLGVDHASWLRTVTFGMGDAGDIVVETDRVSVNRGAQLLSGTTVLETEAI